MSNPDMAPRRGVSDGERASKSAGTTPRRSSDVRVQLAEAAEKQALVRVSRSIRGADNLEGFVVGVGKVWVLLAVLDPNIYLNGYVAVRLADVSKVAVRGGADSFAGRALAARGQWPPVGVDVNLDTVADLVRTAGEAAPLVTVHVEADDPEVCFIGRPVRFTARSVHLLEVSPEAEWHDRPSKWAFAELTRVEFGGRYEEALALVGGPPPA